MLESDKLIVLRIIKHGNYNEVFSLKSNLDYVKPAQITYTLKQKEQNYRLAKNIGNILYPPSENSKIKKNLDNLIAIELNYYNDTKDRDKVYTQLKTLSSDLVVFPVEKRLNKFLTKFVKASKALQNSVIQNDSDYLLKTLKNLVFEVKKNANIS